MLRICICATTVVLALVPQALAYQYTPLSISNCGDFVFDKAGILYAASGSQVVRYDTKAKAYLPSWNVGGSLLGMDLSADGATLAVADASVQGTSNRVFLVNTATGAPSSVSFTRQSLESGTYMVAWGADNRLLITSSFAGSGWVPLRRYDPATGNTVVLRSVDQSAMLTSSADRKFVGYAGSNNSGGPIGLYDVTAGSVTATGGLGHFVFEAAVSPGGNQMAIPTYFGTSIYNRSGSSLVAQGTVLGQYASYGPVGAVYSPIGSVLYTAEWGGTMAGVKAYDTSTWQQIATLDNYNFPWCGNWAMGEGRIEISPDGQLLAAKVAGGIRLYNVPEPASLSLLIVAALGAWKARRRA